MMDEPDRWLWGQRVFCANPACLLHVAAGAPVLQGSGQWASVDGVLYARHPIADHGGALYCSACPRRLIAKHDAALCLATTAVAQAGGLGHGGASGDTHRTVATGTA